MKVINKKYIQLLYEKYIQPYQKSSHFHNCIQNCEVVGKCLIQRCSVHYIPNDIMEEFRSEDGRSKVLGIMELYEEKAQDSDTSCVTDRNKDTENSSYQKGTNSRQNDDAYTWLPDCFQMESVFTSKLISHLHARSCSFLPTQDYRFRNSPIVFCIFNFLHSTGSLPLVNILLLLLSKKKNFQKIKIKNIFF